LQKKRKKRRVKFHNRKRNLQVLPIKDEISQKIIVPGVLVEYLLMINKKHFINILIA